MLQNILKGVTERADDVRILTTWGWVGEMVTQSDERPRVTWRAGWQQCEAAVTSPWLLVVVVVVVVGVGGGGGVGRAAVAARVPKGCPCSLHACLHRHNLRSCLFLHIHTSHGSFSICKSVEQNFFWKCIIQLSISQFDFFFKKNIMVTPPLF